MAIKNYSTKISPGKTIGELQELLIRKGVRTISMELADGKPKAVTFVVDITSRDGNRPVTFRLPCNTEGVLNAMRKAGVQRSLANTEQAERVAWRIVRDWVDAQLAIVEAGQAVLEEVFMPYAIVNPGQTMFDAWKSSVKLLPEAAIEG